MAACDAISQAIREAKAQGSTALIGWVTAGFPKRESFLELLESIAAVSTIVEIGVPFTDPMADGTTIQRASRIALEQGTTLKWILSELARRELHSKTPIVLMSYLNPLLSYGLDKLPSDAARAGVSGFIVPDLPLEECAELKAALDAVGLALVQLVSPVTPEARIAKLSDAATGFLYAVTMTGTTGKNAAMSDDVLDYFARVKRNSKLPVCAGFGIRSREQVEKFAPYVDGVVVASALVEVIERGEDPAAFLRGLRP